MVVYRQNAFWAGGGFLLQYQEGQLGKIQLS